MRESDDLFEFLKSKGMVVDGFKREYCELQTILNDLGDTLQDKDLELEGRSLDIQMIEDQKFVSKKNIEDTIMALKADHAALELSRAKQLKLIEKDFRHLAIKNSYKTKFADLTDALGLGSDWTTAQDEERMGLEKELDFVAKKLDNRLATIHSIRMDTNKLYEQQQQVDQLLLSKDQEINNIHGRIRDIEASSLQIKTKCAERTSNINSFQQQIVQSTASVHDRHSLLTSDHACLQSSEHNLKRARDQMDAYIRSFDALLAVTEGYTRDLDAVMNQNKLAEAMLLESERALATKLEVCVWVWVCVCLGVGVGWCCLGVDGCCVGVWGIGCE